MKNRLTTILALSLLLCLASCSRQPPPDGKRTQEEFASLVRPFPYKASEERRQKIVDSYQQIKKGMSKEDVEKVMGEPDYSDLLYNQGFLGPKYFGSTWMYCIYSTSQFVGTIGGERYVEIYFDLNGKVKDVWVHVRGDEYIK